MGRRVPGRGRTSTSRWSRLLTGRSFAQNSFGYEAPSRFVQFGNRLPMYSGLLYGVKPGSPKLKEGRYDHPHTSLLAGPSAQGLGVDGKRCGNRLHTLGWPTVEEGNDHPGDRKTPNLSDVARLAGVSTATASRVLAKSRPVRDEARRRVLESAATLDYSTNLHARALAQSRDASIGVVVHDVNDPYFSEIVRGVLEGAEASNQMVLISNTYRDIERELEYIRRFRAQRVKALVLAGSGRLDRD